MAKGKRRNAATLLFLLLAFAVFLGIYVWYSNRPDDKEAEETDTILLSDIDTEQVNSLHYIHDDLDITLDFEEGVWTCKEEPERPINQDKVTSMLRVIDEIKADRVISEDLDNLADFGLDQPVSYLQAVLQDKSTVTLQIGNEAGNNGYYALVNEDKKIYLLGSSYGTGLKYADNDFTAMEEAPEISAEHITKITIDRREGEDLELEYREDGYDISGNPLTAWFLNQPYGEGVGADSSAVSEFKSKYTTFDYMTCVDYSAEDLSKYGLDQPLASITVGYQEESTQTLDQPEKDPDTGEEITEKKVYTPKEYKVFVGGQDEDGNYYIRPEGSDDVYNISADTVEKMLEVDAFSLVNTYVCIPDIDDVEKITADIQGTSYNYEIKRSAVEDEKKNEKNEDERTSTYFYNGKEVEEDAFKDFYQILISARYDAEISDDGDKTTASPYLTIRYDLTGGKTVKAVFAPYNDSFYTAGIEEGPKFLIDRRVVEDIASAVCSFTGKAD